LFSWDEWLDVDGDRGRIRQLGADIAESAEEKLKKQVDEDFRRRLFDTNGFNVVDCDRDGNCLFRSVAHQIYGDVNLHAKVRADCYDYMWKNRDFFSLYVAEDLSTYIQRQRQLNQWGDHVEIFAMREMFNKNVEVYDKDNVDKPKPLGLAIYDSLPIMRLSFHGNNHYNSVVDPKQPPPIGEAENQNEQPGQINDNNYTPVPVSTPSPGSDPVYSSASPSSTFNASSNPTLNRNTPYSSSFTSPPQPHMYRTISIREQRIQHHQKEMQSSPHRYGTLQINGYSPPTLALSLSSSLSTPPFPAPSAPPLPLPVTGAGIGIGTGTSTGTGTGVGSSSRSVSGSSPIVSDPLSFDDLRRLSSTFVDPKGTIDATDVERVLSQAAKLVRSRNPNRLNIGDGSIHPSQSTGTTDGYVDWDIGGETRFIIDQCHAAGTRTAGMNGSGNRLRVPFDSFSRLFFQHTLPRWTSISTSTSANRHAAAATATAPAAASNSRMTGNGQHQQPHQHQQHRMY